MWFGKRKKKVKLFIKKGLFLINHKNVKFCFFFLEKGGKGKERGRGGKNGVGGEREKKDLVIQYLPPFWMHLVCCYTFLSLFFSSFLSAIHTHPNDAHLLGPRTLLNPADASFYFFSLCILKDFLQPMLGFMTGFVIDMHIRPLHIR